MYWLTSTTLILYLHVQGNNWIRYNLDGRYEVGAALKDSAACYGKHRTIVFRKAVLDSACAARTYLEEMREQGLVKQIPPITDVADVWTLEMLQNRAANA